MLTYLGQRLMACLFSIVGVVTLVFGVLRAVPGDPVESILGEQAMEADKMALRACLGLERPLWNQYAGFWMDVLTGSLGELCDERGVTVSDKILAHLPATLELAMASLALAVMVFVPLGVLASLKPGTWVDHWASTLSLAGMAVPSFWLGPLLLVSLSAGLGIFPNPVDDAQSLMALLLPALTLGLGLGAKLMRMVRASMLEVLGQDFVRTAHAKGLGPWTVVLHHALRNALLPVVTVLGMQFGALLSGAIIVEKVFARPGLGTLLLEGIEARNYLVVQGCVLFISMAYVVVNLLTDLLYGSVDPRIRIAQGREAR